jgi:hypothetical protein
VQDSGMNKVITLDRGLDNAMASGVTVASCIVKTTVKADVTATSATGGSVAQSQVQMNNAGAIDAIFTLTFTSATDYSLTCNARVLTGVTGNVSSVFSPNNSDIGQPYFSLPPAFFTGSFTTAYIQTLAVHAQKYPSLF